MSSAVDSRGLDRGAVSYSASVAEMTASRAWSSDAVAADVRRMRIVFVCRSLTIGGAERQLVLLARGLAERGHEVTIVSFYSEGQFAGDVVVPGIRLVNLHKRGRYELLRPLLRVRRELAQRQPDVVHGYLPVPNLFTLVALTLRVRPKIVWGLRDSDMQSARYDLLSRLVYWLECRTSRRADMAIANSVSGAQVAVARGLRTRHLRVVPNGVDLDVFTIDDDARARTRAGLALDDDMPVIGHFARLDPMKDHETFLQAIRLLMLRRAVTALCIAVGTARDVAAFDRRVAELGLATVVKRIDPTSQIQQIYPACDVYCLSSSFGEGCPNVLLEAMACGVPCVATDVGDAEVLVGALGDVAKRGDPASLADALERMIRRMHDERDTLRPSLRRRAAEFSLDQLYVSTERALGYLLSETGGDVELTAPA